MNTKGFTLLEVSIYAALFSLLLGGVAPAAYQLVRNSEHAESVAVADQEAGFIDQKMLWALSIAGGATTPTPDTLSLTSTDADEGTFIFTGNGTKIMFSRGVEPALPLNADTAEITNVRFSTTPSSGASTGQVTATFSVNGTPFHFSYSLPHAGLFPPLCNR